MQACMVRSCKAPTTTSPHPPLGRPRSMIDDLFLPYLHTPPSLVEHSCVSLHPLPSLSPLDLISYLLASHPPRISFKRRPASTSGRPPTISHSPTVLRSIRESASTLFTHLLLISFKSQAGCRTKWAMVVHHSIQRPAPSTQPAQ